MNILLLHQYFRTSDMPGGTRTYELARRWVAEGNRVEVITGLNLASEATKQWSHSTVEGISVHWFHSPYSQMMTMTERLRAFFEFAWVADRRAAGLDGDFDLVVASSTPLTIALPAVRAAKRLGVPLVFEVRDLWPEVPIALGALQNPLARTGAKRLERYAYDNAAHVVALSPGMADGVVATGFPRSKVSVIPNSCDFDIFEVSPEEGLKLRAAHDWLGDRPLGLYLGTVGPVNDVGWLLDLAHEVRRLDPETRFWINGEGSEHGAIRFRAGQEDLLNKTVFVGEDLPKPRVPPMLSAADVAFSVVADVPELNHNSANKVFDALASGTPVVINHEGWQADFIRETGCGMVLDRHDIEGSARRLVDFLRDKAELERAGDAAVKLAHERFSRDDHAAQYLEIMNELVG